MRHQLSLYTGASRWRFSNDGSQSATRRGQRQTCDDDTAAKPGSGDARRGDADCHPRDAGEANQETGRETYVRNRDERQERPRQRWASLISTSCAKPNTVRRREKPL